MQCWRGIADAPPGWGRCVVTIGVFDGVHVGHRRIIGRAVQSAVAADLPCVVLTFDPHPSEVVRPGSHPAVLTTPRHKAELVQALGADVLCVLPFTPEFARIGPDEFVHTVLVGQLHARAVVVGENLRYGRKAAGTLDTLRHSGDRFGFSTEAVPLLRRAAAADAAISAAPTDEPAGPDSFVYSSTFVRACIAAGDVAAAAQALGRPHRVEGVVVRGDQRGRQLGYPTANLETAPYAAIPADGVYAGWMLAGGERYPTAISIGTNPTFDGRIRRIEGYALDVDLDLYGDHVAFDVVDRVRDMQRFDGVEELLVAMRHDVDTVRGLLRG